MYLLYRGANPKAKDNAGETAPHLTISKNTEFRIMSKFIENMGAKEIQTIRDENGNTLFHYAAGTMDEDTIYYMMSIGGFMKF